MASNKDNYEAVEQSVRDYAAYTQARKDIDQETKNQILLNQSSQLDKLRKERGIKE